MKIKIFLMVTLICLFVSPAYALDCEVEITVVQDMIANAPATTLPETLTQAKNLIEEAISLCATGDNDASLMKLNEAKSLINQ